MNTYTNESVTLVAGEALEAYRRVKLSSGNAVYADAGEDSIGVTMSKVANAEAVKVKLFNDSGSFPIEAAGAIVAGATVYGAADGKIDDTVSGDPIGSLAEGTTAAVAGDICQVVLVKSSTLNELNGVTAGTVTASKALVVDANKDLGDMRNLDVVNLDAGASGTAGSVDVFPATESKGKLTISVADQTGDTAVTLSANEMGQATTVNIADPGAAASYVVQSTAALTLAEVDVLDAVTAGTVAASKAVVVDANKDVTGFRNITATGTVDCGATCEADAFTVGGVAGADFGPAAPASITVVKGIVTAASS